MLGMQRMLRCHTMQRQAEVLSALGALLGLPAAAAALAESEAVGLAATAAEE